MTDKTLANEILRKVNALLPMSDTVDFEQTNAAVWREGRWGAGLRGVTESQSLTLTDLLNIDVQKEKLVGNTRQFLAGLPANNALLWGSRGSGKSSLIHALLNEFAQQGLRLVEIGRDDLGSLPELIAQLQSQPYRFIVFSDDLSFEANDGAYKALKSALEGSALQAASNVVFYATSNRRHLLPEYAADNQHTEVVDTELHHGEAVEEKVSLSDRFGLWLSFYPLKQDAYLDVVRHWVQRIGEAHTVAVDLDCKEMRAQALQWALSRGVRNARTAQYFARHWVGQKGLETDAQ